MKILEIIIWLFLVGNLFMAYRIWREYRRALLFSVLLEKLVIDAFKNQHLPIWVPWSRVTGIYPRIIIDNEREKDGQ